VSSSFLFRVEPAGARSVFGSMGLICTGRHRIEAGIGAHALAGSCELAMLRGIHFWRDSIDDDGGGGGASVQDPVGDQE
jgi:hypothetical protein